MCGGPEEPPSAGWGCVCYYLCFGERRRSFLLCEWVLSQVEPTDGFTEPGPWITAQLRDEAPDDNCTLS